MVNLTRMRVLIKHEQRLMRKRKRAFANATKVTTVLTGMPRGGSGNQSQVETGAIELAEIEESYREVFEELKAMRAELEEMLPRLENIDDIGIIRLRYFEGHNPEEIPDLVNLSIRSVYYHLSGAEKKLMRLFPDRVIKQ